MEHHKPAVLLAHVVLYLVSTTQRRKPPRVSFSGSSAEFVGERCIELKRTEDSVGCDWGTSPPNPLGFFALVLEARWPCESVAKPGKRCRFGVATWIPHGCACNRLGTTRLASSSHSILAAIADRENPSTRIAGFPAKRGPKRLGYSLSHPQILRRKRKEDGRKRKQCVPETVSETRTETA